MTFNIGNPDPLNLIAHRRPLDSDGKPVPTAQEEALAERVVRVEKERDELVEALRHHAQTMRQWAAESIKGGWSTHQVTPMRNAADGIDVLLSRYPKP